MPRPDLRFLHSTTLRVLIVGDLWQASLWGASTWRHGALTKLNVEMWANGHGKTRKAGDGVKISISILYTLLDKELLGIYEVK